MITAYYNEFDKKSAAWLRQLIKNGNITPGEVDERSITEVSADDLVGFDRCHFFSGIGTWDYCLNQAGWGDRPIWTASLPCQPFSAAGKGLGKADERHLLPHFLDLVREHRPATMFGEQVPGAIKHGWLDDLYAEMEACNYAIGTLNIGAHSIGAPHIRQRLYWVANAVNYSGERSLGRIYGEEKGSQIGNRQDIAFTRESCGTGTDVCGMGNSSIATGERHTGRLHSQENGVNRERSSYGNLCFGSSDASEIDWIYCRDNKYRPVKPSIQPLVDGATRTMGYSGNRSKSVDEPIEANKTAEARTMRLKGYGNAIQAQTAIAFITAYMSI